jgi:hypothetical protein
MHPCFYQPIRVAQKLFDYMGEGLAFARRGAELQRARMQRRRHTVLDTASSRDKDAGGARMQCQCDQAHTLPPAAKSRLLGCPDLKLI